MRITQIRFSPEIEVEYPDYIDTYDIMDDKHCNMKHYLKDWEITEDGSLDNGLEYKPSNKNHLFYDKKSLLQIKKLLKMIKTNEGYINSNCGLHIHVDISNFLDEEITRIIKCFLANQIAIITKFKVYRNRLDSYCHPLPEHLKNLTTNNISEFRNYCKADFWRENKKYYALNIDCIRNSSYQTLEFRLFNGTLNYETMKTYIFWALNFVCKAKNLQYITI
jgi:hypothetical protein